MRTNEGRLHCRVVRPRLFPAVSAVVVHRAVIAASLLPAVPPEVAAQLLRHAAYESMPERRLCPQPEVQWSDGATAERRRRYAEPQAQRQDSTGLEEAGHRLATPFSAVVALDVP